MKLSIVIPAYNEEATVRKLVEKILSVPFSVEYEVIIVDDHSVDRTQDICSELTRDSAGKVRVFRNEINRGKGFSIHRGFEYATGDFVVVQDADFEYDPADIQRMIETVLSGSADIVFGSRFLKAAHPEGMAFPNLMANRLLTWIVNVMYSVKLTDVYSCYKLMPLKIIRQMTLNREGFESEAEILAQLLKSKLRVLEIPISYQGRTVKQGKKIKAWDFFLAVQVLFFYLRAK